MNIKRARKKKKLTIRDVSRMTNISISMLSQVENDKRFLPKNAIKRRDLSVVLGISLSEVERVNKVKKIKQGLDKLFAEIGDEMTVQVFGEWFRSRNKTIDNAKNNGNPKREN